MIDMDRLHAYWRYEYIEAPKTQTKTLFEDIAKSENDEENYVVYRTQLSYLVLHAFPYNVGHLLAVPNRAVQNLSDLSDEERFDLMNLVAFAENLLKKALKPDGLNVGINLGSAAGAGIPQHLRIGYHLHPAFCRDR